MKEVKIQKGENDGAEGFWIDISDDSPYGDGFAGWACKERAPARRYNPLSLHEELVSALCERILELERKEK